MTVKRLRRTDSGLLFHARYVDGVVRALTGQKATFARAATAPFVDSNGRVGEAGHSRPRFQVSGGRPAVLLEAAADAGAVETLYHDWAEPPSVPFALLATFVVPLAADSQHAVVIGSQAGPHVLVRLTGGTELRADHDNGSSSVSTSTSGLDASDGDVVDALVRFRADGSLGLEGAANGGTVVTATDTAALAPADSWGEPRIYTAHADDSVGRTSIVREIKVHPDPEIPFAVLVSGPREEVPEGDLPGGLGFRQAPEGWWSVESVGPDRFTFSEHVDGYLVLDTPILADTGKVLSRAASGYLEIT